MDAGDRVDLLATGPGTRIVRERSAAEVSEDARLVDAAREGSGTAFGSLYNRYARMVHGVLLAKVPPSDVDDLVQDVFVQALRRLSTLRESGSFGAWLTTIARNRANDYYRRAVPESPLPDDPAEDEARYGSARGGQESPAAEVLDAIKSLPNAYRETLILRLVEGMTGAEIAASTGMTHGSVRVNLHRGMQQLRAKLLSISGSGTQEQEKP
jgi:RNA polymerase sigma-70 factor (ECF subfamily)